MKVRSKKPKNPTRLRVRLEPDTYVVPVSGGKDSQLVLSNAVRDYGPKNVIAVHHFTGFDHPVTMAHMDYMSELYGVPIEHTVNPNYRDMHDLLDKRNIIPGRVSRFCTDELKIKAFHHWLSGRTDLRNLMVLLGMRGAESQQRSERYSEFSPDDVFSLRDLNPKRVPKKFESVRVRLPIVHLSTNEVFDVLKSRGEKVNPLYARGHKRVGCYPCILAGKGDYVLTARDPVGREHIITLANFKDTIVARKSLLEPEVILPHDLDEILYLADNDPFGFYEEDEAGAGCQWCAM